MTVLSLKHPTSNPVNLYMGLHGLITVFVLLLHLHLEQHRFLRLAFYQSQRTGTDNTLLQGKTVEPLSMAEETWSLELTLLLRKEGEDGRLKFSFCKSIPLSPSDGLNFWALIWVVSQEIITIFFLFSCFILGNNKQEIFYRNTIRINRKDREKLTSLECLLKVKHVTVNLHNMFY